MGEMKISFAVILSEASRSSISNESQDRKENGCSSRHAYHPPPVFSSVSVLPMLITGNGSAYLNDK